MISLEKARALREAGLKWEPKPLDRFYYAGHSAPYYVWYYNTGDSKVIFKVPTTINGKWDGLNEDYKGERDINDCIFAPRLDQLLGEIERRGRRVNSEQQKDGYFTSIFKQLEQNGSYFFEHATDIFPNREDAAADALLWIMGQEGDGEK